MSNIDKFSEARDNAYGVITNLSYIIDALETVGNDELARKLKDIEYTMVSSVNKMYECFRGELHGRYEDSVQATGNMLGAVLAVTQRGNK